MTVRRPAPQVRGYLECRIKRRNDPKGWGDTAELKKVITSGGLTSCGSSLVGFAARALLLLFLSRLARRRRIGLGQDAGDRAAPQLDPHSRGAIDLAHLRADPLGDGAQGAPAGHPPVA